MSLGKRLAAAAVLSLNKRAATAPASPAADVPDPTTWWNRLGNKRLLELSRRMGKLGPGAEHTKLYNRRKQFYDAVDGVSEDARKRWNENFIRGQKKFNDNFNKSMHQWTTEQADLQRRAKELGIPVPEFNFKYDPSTAKNLNEGIDPYSLASRQYQLNNHKNRAYREAYEKYNNNLRSLMDDDRVANKYFGTDTTKQYQTSAKPAQPTQPGQQTKPAQPGQSTPQKPTTASQPQAAQPNTQPAANQGSTIDIGGGQSITKVKTNNGMYQVTFPGGRKVTYTTDPGNDPNFYNRSISKYNDRQAIGTKTKQFGRDVRKHFDAYNKLYEEHQRLPDRLGNGQANTLKAHLGKQLAAAKKIMQSNYGQYMGDPNALSVDRPFNTEDFTYNDKNRNFHRLDWSKKPQNLTNAMDIAKWERDQYRGMQLDQQVALMEQRRKQQLQDEFNNRWNPQPVAKPQANPATQPSKTQPKLYSQMTPQEHRAAGQRTTEDALSAFGLDKSLPMSYNDVYGSYD